MSEENAEFVQEHPDHHFRTEIPNIIGEILNPIQLAVYFHIKRITGEAGRCWMTMKHLAHRIGIGITTLRQCLQELSTKDLFIKGCLIEIIHRNKPDGSKDSNLIKIVDIWRINGDHYRTNRGTSPNGGGVPRVAREGTSPNEHKEEPIKNIERETREALPSINPSEQTKPYGEYVKLKDPEHAEMITKWGKPMVKRLIDDVNAYCMTSRTQGYANYPKAMETYYNRMSDSKKAKISNPNGPGIGQKSKGGVSIPEMMKNQLEAKQLENEVFAMSPKDRGQKSIAAESDKVYFFRGSKTECLVYDMPCEQFSAVLNQWKKSFNK